MLDDTASVLRVELYAGKQLGGGVALNYRNVSPKKGIREPPPPDQPVFGGLVLVGIRADSPCGLFRGS